MKFAKQVGEGPCAFGNLGRRERGSFHVAKNDPLTATGFVAKQGVTTKAVYMRCCETTLGQQPQRMGRLPLALFGRLPDPEEYPQHSEIVSRFGSLKRAFALVCRITGEDTWDPIRRRRTEDLVVFLALAQFRKRPKLSGYPRTLQRDFRAFFGTYMKACGQADALLFRAGNAVAIDEACQRSPIGKLLPNALYVHRSALDCLEPLLRIYEGCARSFLGEIEGANIIKLHRFSGKVSYLAYPDFDTDPHPALARSVKLSLRTRELECLDYSDTENPPVLHRKETFLPFDHPLHAKFVRLTQQEERYGLLNETASIGTRDGWDQRLREAGFRLRSHRLIRQVSGRPGDVL